MWLWILLLGNEAASEAAAFVLAPAPTLRMRAGQFSKDASLTELDCVQAFLNVGDPWGGGWRGEGAGQNAVRIFPHFLGFSAYFRAILSIFSGFFCPHHFRIPPHFCPNATAFFLSTEENYAVRFPPHNCNLSYIFPHIFAFRLWNDRIFFPALRINANKSAAKFSVKHLQHVIATAFFCLTTL